MKISLQLTPKCKGPEYDTNDLPQDGQRLIKELEDRTMVDMVDMCKSTRDTFLNCKQIKKDVFALVIRYTLTHGKVPLYFSARFYATSDIDAHRHTHELMKNLPAILDDYFKNK